MTFATQLTADVAAVFCNAAEFGETDTYYPRDGAPRSIVAVVNRQNRNTEDGNRHQVDVHSIDVFCALSSTTGIEDPDTGDALKLSEDRADFVWSFDFEHNRDAAGIYTHWRRKAVRHSGRIRPEQL